MCSSLLVFHLIFYDHEIFIQVYLAFLGTRGLYNSFVKALRIFIAAKHSIPTLRFHLMVKTGRSHNITHGSNIKFYCSKITLPTDNITHLNKNCKHKNFQKPSKPTCRSDTYTVSCNWVQGMKIVL